MRRWQEHLREEAIEHYGGKCECCFDRTYEFLTIEAYEPKTRQMRKKSNYRAIELWLHAHDFPKGFRVMCWNCSGALARDGYCPHHDNAI